MEPKLAISIRKLSPCGPSNQSLIQHGGMSFALVAKKLATSIFRITLNLKQSLDLAMGLSISWFNKICNPNKLDL